MASDAVVWEVRLFFSTGRGIINHGHCSFKAKMDRQNFCRNEYNVSGLCNRSSCPLANSRYATIREDKGRIYLYIKTIERSHTPKKLWQRIRLSRKYMSALEQIDEHLAHWPKFLVHKNKQRLTKITQYLIRMRKLALKPQKKIVTQPTRSHEFNELLKTASKSFFYFSRSDRSSNYAEQNLCMFLTALSHMAEVFRLKKMEKRKEKKAEKAADIESAIETELMTRLQSGTYGDIYNFPLAQYNAALDKKSVPDQDEAEMEYDASKDAEGSEYDEDSVSEVESEEEGHMEYVEDLEESDDDIEDIAARLGSISESDGTSSEGEDSSDGEEEPPAKGKSDKRKRRGRGMEIEYEQEHNHLQQ